MQQQQAIPVQIDLKNAKQKECPCGCKVFQQAFEVFTVSALVSPTGQEMIASKPVMVCLACRNIV